MKKLLAIAMACSVLLLSLMTGCKPSDVAVARRIQKSTVLVHVLISKGEKHGGALCAGVVVSPHQILLADHCVDPRWEGVKVDKVFIKNYSGRVQLATIEEKDRGDDLALLRVRKWEYPADVASSQPKVGSTLWVVGMPLGLQWSVSKGIVSQIDINAEGFSGSFFITDATVLPGNSGGGAWNSQGQLVGIVSMSTSMFGGFGAAGLGIIVDTETINNFIDK